MFCIHLFLIRGLSLEVLLLPVSTRLHTLATGSQLLSHQVDFGALAMQ